MRRQLLLVEAVSVSNEHLDPVGIDKCVVGQHGEREHHLIHLAVTVAANADHPVAPAVQKLRDTLRIVPLGKRVPRPVIEQITHQHELVGLLAVKGFEQPLTPQRRPVDVRCDNKLHQPSSFSFASAV